ncbi:sensor histidine kinase [Nocardiopsis sp. EMB25]|uniref:sensor histidine kinase n=1 Tax=Nocardiopsis sp. EMB25 TaxID=2835867 RepID=UPI0022850E07|nr:sensor histidine kinase [Nocardiopsis sp. EMB25]MCY9782302.1 sensor histidine kinase [Nocardiopsis sp. EMB25]
MTEEREDDHAWHVDRAWGTYFTGSTAVIAVIAVMTGDGWRGWVTAALLGGVVVWYLLLGRRLLRPQEFHGSPRTIPFLAGLVALMVPALVLTPTATFAMFSVSPLVFMTGGAWLGTATAAALLFGPILFRLVSGSLPWKAAAPELLIFLVILFFSLWFARWFERVIVQSHERADLIAALRTSREESTRLSEEAGALAERERLARELHDTLAQGLTSIIALSQAVESELDTDPDLARRHLALMRETATENLAEARAIVAARQPVQLENETLEAALSRLTERFGRESGVTARLSVNGDPVFLPGAHQVCLLRTAQEALANVRRHARAGRVGVTLGFAPESVELSVTDDGRGFTPLPDSRGHGLPGMRARAEALGGRVHVASAPGTGTTVRLLLPLDPEPGDPAAPAAPDSACERRAVP